MLSRSAHNLTALEERTEAMPGCHPSDPTIALQDYAARPRSFDVSRHSYPNEQYTPVPSHDKHVGNGPESNTYTYGTPRKQIRKIHSHRLVHPCTPVSNEPTMQVSQGAFHGNQDSNVLPFAHQLSVAAHTAGKLQPHRPIQQSRGDASVTMLHEDIESGLVSSSSSGRSSTSSLVRGAGESVLAGIDWASSKVAKLFSASQPKKQWSLDGYEHSCKQAKAEIELDRFANSEQYFTHQYA